MVNSSSRTDILWPVVTEQIEYQLDQKQDADGSHVALHTPQAFHPHSLITLQAGGNSGNGVRRNRRASWKDRRCSPESTGCLFADLGHVPFQTDRWPTFLFVLSDMRPSLLLRSNWGAMDWICQRIRWLTIGQMRYAVVMIDASAAWEQRIADLWASIDDYSEEAFLARM